MIYQGTRIKTPPKKLIWKKQSKDGQKVWWEFPFKWGNKKPNTVNEYEYEEYWIMAMNEPQEGTEYYINIRGCKPQVNKSKDGRQFLCCFICCDLNLEKQNVGRPSNNGVGETNQYHQHNDVPAMPKQEPKPQARPFNAPDYSDITDDMLPF